MSHYAIAKREFVEVGGGIPSQFVFCFHTSYSESEVSFIGLVVVEVFVCLVVERVPTQAKVPEATRGNVFQRSAKSITGLIDHRVAVDDVFLFGCCRFWSSKTEFIYGTYSQESKGRIFVDSGVGFGLKVPVIGPYG